MRRPRILSFRWWILLTAVFLWEPARVLLFCKVAANSASSISWTSRTRCHTCAAFSFASCASMSSCIFLSLICVSAHTRLKGSVRCASYFLKNADDGHHSLSKIRTVFVIKTKEAGISYLLLTRSVTYIPIMFPPCSENLLSHIFGDSLLLLGCGQACLRVDPRSQQVLWDAGKQSQRLYSWQKLIVRQNVQGIVSAYRSRVSFRRPEESIIQIFNFIVPQID